MPELPEVETTCRGISQHILNNEIASVLIRNDKMRLPTPLYLTEILNKKKIINISRRAKYILIKFDHGTLILHLGMSGTLRVIDTKEEFKKHDHFIINFTDNNSLRLNDPRRFGLVDWVDEQNNLFSHKMLAKLGPEPLTADFTAEYLENKLKDKNTAIKLFIMNPQIVVGVGNIYANEALFLSKINPTRPAKSLSILEINELVKNIKLVLKAGIKAGGTTLRDFANADGKPGYFQQQLRVYGRENQPCVICNTVLTSIRQGQRATVFCAQCQT